MMQKIKKSKILYCLLACVFVFLKRAPVCAFLTPFFLWILEISGLVRIPADGDVVPIFPFWAKGRVCDSGVTSVLAVRVHEGRPDGRQLL
jgi:hypothetical protein